MLMCWWIRINGTFWKTTTFEQTPIMSSYLLAFSIVATGHYESITFDDPEENSTLFSVYSSRDAVLVNGTEFALDFGRKALKSLELYIGHDYPLEKMDFIAIDDFLMGAMENYGLVSFKWVQERFLFSSSRSPFFPILWFELKFVKILYPNRIGISLSRTTMCLNIEEMKCKERKRNRPKMKSNEKLMMREKIEFKFVGAHG